MSPRRKSVVCNRSHAEVIFRVRRYFENEELCQRRSDLHKVIQRTVEATGFCKKTVSKINSELVVTNWKFQGAQCVQRNRSMNVGKKYESVVRQVIRNLFLEKKEVPTLDSVLTKLKGLNLSDVVQHNLFDDHFVPAEEEKIWTWVRTTLYRYMQSIGFIYDD